MQCFLERMHKSFNSRSNNNNTNNRPHTCIIGNLPETLMEVAKLQDQPSCMLIQYSCLQYTQVETETHASDCRMEPVLIDWVRRAKYLVNLSAAVIILCDTSAVVCQSIPHSFREQTYSQHFSPMPILQP